MSLTNTQITLLKEFTLLFAPHEIYLVGGSVRDIMLDRPGDDFDFATSALPTESEAILREWGNQFWDPGAEYGTVCASKLMGPESDPYSVKVEVTTYRKDTYDPDSRKPEVEFGDNIHDDLLRRDFTVNAMAMRLNANGDVELAYLDGALDHLDAHLLKTPLDPEVSFADDPLRIIRAARFVSQLGFTMEEDTFGAIKRKASELDKVAPERIIAELDKTLVGKNAYMGMSLLYYTDVLPRILPGVIVNHFFHLDDLPRDLETRWAGLLFGIGPVRAKELLIGLKHNHYIFNTVPRIIAIAKQFFARGGEWDAAQVRKFVWDAGENFHSAMELVYAMYPGSESVQLFGNLYVQLADAGDVTDLKQPLDGADVMGYLQIPPGKLVGDAIKHLQNHRLEYGPMEISQAYHQLNLWWKGKA